MTQNKYLLRKHIKNDKQNAKNINENIIENGGGGVNKFVFVFEKKM